MTSIPSAAAMRAMASAVAKSGAPSSIPGRMCACKSIMFFRNPEPADKHRAYRLFFKTVSDETTIDPENFPYAFHR
jgi:hypothetical protein